MTKMTDLQMPPLGRRKADYRCSTVAEESSLSLLQQTWQDTEPLTRVTSPKGLKPAFFHIFGRAKYWIYWDMEGRFLLKTY